MSCDGLGHPVELLLTAAQESDVAQAEALLAGHRPEEVIAAVGTTSGRWWRRSSRAGPWR